jgi:hypothetical protein
MNETNRSFTPITLPQHSSKRGGALVKALQLRQTTREIADSKLPAQTRADRLHRCE